MFPKRRSGQPLPLKGDNSLQGEQQRLASAVAGQLGLPSFLLRRTSALQEQQTEGKRREWLSPQQQLPSKVNRRSANWNIVSDLEIRISDLTKFETWISDSNLPLVQLLTARREPLPRFLKCQIIKTGVLGKKSEFGLPRWPIALFADDYLGPALVRAIRVVNLIAVDKGDHISILLYGARFPQIS